MKIISTNKNSGQEQTYSSKTAMSKALAIPKCRITKAIDTNSELKLDNSDILVLRAEGVPYGQKGKEFNSIENEIEHLQNQNSKLQNSFSEIQSKIDTNNKRIEILKRKSEGRKLIDEKYEAQKNAEYAELEKIINSEIEQNAA